MSSPELVLDGIEQLYRAAVDPGYWPDALHSLRAIFASDACAIARHDFAPATAPTSTRRATGRT